MRISGVPLIKNVAETFHKRKWYFPSEAGQIRVFSPQHCQLGTGKTYPETHSHANSGSDFDL